MPTFLHVGCGQSSKERTTRGFNTPDWIELRLDIEPTLKPDYLCSMTEMTPVADASVDAVFSSHNLEHLYWHEVPAALREFHRVLRPDGFVVLTCPDLQSVGALLAEGKLLDAAYQSPAGPVAAIDILYGYRRALANGVHSMAHKCGFTAPVLQRLLHEAGFKSWASMRRAKNYDLFAVGSKSDRCDDELRALAHLHFPIGASVAPQPQDQRA